MSEALRDPAQGPRRRRTIGRIIAIAAPLFIALPLMAQGSAGSAGKLEPRALVDQPTAGMLGSGSYAIDMDFYQEGGVVLGVTAGLMDRFSFGVSYGGSRLLGSSPPLMNELPGVHLKVRIVEESFGFPALAIGFDSQGKDGYLKELDRYVIKSPGLYAVASKNYLLLGYFSLHGGINYSFERADDDRDFNLFIGAEKTIGPSISLALEYNLGMNDNSSPALGAGRGYLNAGLRWGVGSGLTLALHLKDLLHNAQDETAANRTVRLEYVRSF